MVGKKHNTASGANRNAQRSKRRREDTHLPGYNGHHVFGFESDFTQHARRIGIATLGGLQSVEHRYIEGDSDPTIGREEEDEDRRKWEKRYWSVPMYRFFHSRSWIGENGWTAVRPLGIGGTGMAVLWERNDECKEPSMYSSRHMVIKETLPSIWGGSGSDGGNIDDDEFLIQRALTELDCDNSNILKILRYVRFPEQEKHRYYLEWAPHDTLYTLFKRYKRWRRYFPEPFIWHVFHQLAKAVLLMQKGRLPAQEIESEPEDEDEEEEDPTKVEEKDKAAIYGYNINKKPELIQLVRNRGIRVEKSELKAKKEYFARKLVEDDKRAAKEAKKRQAPEEKKGKAEPTIVEDFPPIAGWREIVHRDMKPANIFLGEPLEDSHFPTYPTIKLADFGHAMRTYEGDPKNPEIYQHFVQKYFDAPEQDVRVDGLRQVEDRLSAHTNVYQLGFNMFHLATFKNTATFTKDRKNLSFNPNRTPPYSRALLRLIVQCMQPDPAERPTPLQLYSLTQHCAKECWNYVKDDPDRFHVYYRGVEVNDMDTSFYKIEDRKPKGLYDLPFPVTGEDLEPPEPARFHPYSSHNLEFFTEANNAFRNDRDREGRIRDCIDIEDYPSHHYARRVDAEFDPDAPDSDDDEDEARVKATNRAEKARRKAAREAEKQRKLQAAKDAGGSTKQGGGNNGDGGGAGA